MKVTRKVTRCCVECGWVTINLIRCEDVLVGGCADYVCHLCWHDHWDKHDAEADAQ